VSKAQSNRRLIIAALIIAVIVIAAVAFAYTYLTPQPRTHIIVSTTTSLYETGFLDVLKKAFEAKYPEYNVSFISQGTGLAIQTAMRGDADMILVHDAARELQFLKASYGVNRKIVAYNFFIIVGPKEDPAGTIGKDPVEAFEAIRTAGLAGKAVWVSRGDDSGTHAKEKSLWKAAGLDSSKLRTESWYLEAGTGMTATLMMANEKRAYTICDISTYLAISKKGSIDLPVLVEASKSTLNVYSAIAGNPQNSNLTKANFKGSMAFISFLVSDEGQNLFADFGVDTYGKALFTPYVKNLKEGQQQDIVKWVQELAYFDGSECPLQYRYQSGNLYS